MTEDKLPSSIIPFVHLPIRLFMWSRNLSKRITENHPAWLGKGVLKSIRSSIVEHLVDTEHQVVVRNASSV